MKTITKIRLLNHFHLFNIARDFYYRITKKQKDVFNFYKEFIHHGDLCFDIGANIGMITDVFLKLGAKVIAIEPNPVCVRYLRKKYLLNKKVTVIDQALDEVETQREFYSCEANALSTLSKEWLSSVQKNRYRDFKWKKTIITTTTLDHLVAQFGNPHFCKIDVEGYELQVLKGLTQPLSRISLEICPENYDNIKACILYLTYLGNASFNFCPNFKEFISKNWLKSEEMLKYLNSRPIQKIYGDIYAQFN